MGSDIFKEPTILYVDDQPSHLELFKRAFQGDFLVLTAPNGEKGLEILEEHDVFLVIADHNMPRMTGVDFLKRAQPLAPKAEQAILSAYLNDEMVKEAAQRVKLAGHLSKPWKLDQMRSFIEEAYQRYEIGVPAEQPSQRELPSEQGWLSTRQLSRFTETLEDERVDRRGARRVFLNFVEPPLKSFVPRIHRPGHPLLMQAQNEAVKGNLEQFQKILLTYLKEVGLSETAGCGLNNGVGPSFSQ